MDSNQKYGGNSTNHQDIYESDGGIAQTNTGACQHYHTRYGPFHSKGKHFNHSSFDSMSEL